MDSKACRLLLAALFFLSAADARAEPANFAGFGLMTCAQVTEKFIRDQTSAFELFQWAAGYMSGLNAASIARDNTFRDFDGLVNDGKAGGLVRPLLRTCRDHPQLVFADVVQAYYSQMRVRKWSR